MILPAASFADITLAECALPAMIFPAASLAVATLAGETGALFMGVDDLVAEPDRLPLMRDFFAIAIFVISLK
jgi:hypothetical protein